jgi:sugar lactone lactonase YvrE
MIQERLYTSPEALPHSEPFGELELVAQFYGPMPVGVTVTRHNRIFVCFPRWGDEVTFTVAEVRDGECSAYPLEGMYQAHTPTASDVDQGDYEATLLSVQSVVVDPVNRLWLLDTGSPMFQPTRFGGPKLVSVDLAANRVSQVILIPEQAALSTTYLNDVRFDLRRGAMGMAFITDSSDQGPNGIIVVDLATGECWRRLHDHPSTKAEGLDQFRPVVEGRPLLQRDPSGGTSPLAVGANGIAMGAGGNRLYYCPLAGRRLYSVSIDAIVDQSLDPSEVNATVRDEGDRGGGADGLESDEEGRIYATNYEHNAVLRRRTDGEWETLVYDPRLLWPDAIWLAQNGFLYIIANQLHRQPRFHAGHDRRRKPYSLFRTRVDGRPLRLR